MEAAEIVARLRLMIEHGDPAVRAQGRELAASVGVETLHFWDAAMLPAADLRFDTFRANNGARWEYGDEQLWLESVVAQSRKRLDLALELLAAAVARDLEAGEETLEQQARRQGLLP